MSDIKTQTSAADELPGGQAPLTERTGAEHSVVFPLSGRSGSQVDNDVQAVAVSPNLANGAASRPSELNAGLNAGSGRAVTVVPVDSKTITGSYAGDHRTNASPAQLPSNPAPRSGMTQAPFGKNTPSNLPTQSFPGNQSDSEAGN